MCGPSLDARSPRHLVAAPRRSTPRTVKPVIIGAGRGRRLKHLTDEIPKTLVPIVGRPMLESILEALEAGGFSRDEVVFICGYKADVIQDRYPALTYVENRDWPNNNILLSLLCARPHLEQGFVSTYADIVYRPEAIAKVTASPHDITLVCDCLLYTSPSPRDRTRSRMPSSA